MQLGNQKRVFLNLGVKKRLFLTKNIYYCKSNERQRKFSKNIAYLCFNLFI
jgi:hypothetical protein